MPRTMAVAQSHPKGFAVNMRSAYRVGHEPNRLDQGHLPAGNAAARFRPALLPTECPDGFAIMRRQGGADAQADWLRRREPSQGFLEPKAGHRADPAGSA